MKPWNRLSGELGLSWLWRYEDKGSISPSTIRKDESTYAGAEMCADTKNCCCCVSCPFFNGIESNIPMLNSFLFKEKTLNWDYLKKKKPNRDPMTPQRHNP
jgi:hypothetical protein